MIALSASQQRAVEQRAGRLVVVAGAGSGKTTLLVERYLAHVLEDGLTPSSVLTVTFTRASTAEMRERIVRRLEQAGRPDLAQEAETGPIQTLHSFCERILRECSFDAVIDPRFEVATGAAVDRALEAAFRDALAETAPTRREVVALVDEMGGESEYRGISGVHGRLFGLVRSLLSSLRSAGVTREAVLADHADEAAVLRTWAKAVWEGLGGEPGHAPQTPAEAVAQLREANVRVPWRSADDDAPAARLTVGLARLAVATWEAMERRMTEARQTDFAMLESLALRLLETDPVATDRVRQTYRALLVDETQDINPVQHRIFDALGIEPMMVVGDAAQSIYGFRGADPEGFLALPGAERADPLSTNYRSRPGILQFVDAVFARRWGDGYVRMESSREDVPEPPVEIWDMPESDSRLVAQHVERLVAEGFRPGQIAMLSGRNAMCATLAEAVRERGIPATVSGGSRTFFTQLEVRDLANVLEALAMPQADYPLLAVLRSPLAGLSLDSVVLLAKSGDVWANLAGFQPPVAEDRQRLDTFLDWFGRLLPLAKRMPAWEALGAVLADSPCLEALASLPDGPAKLANARKLLRMAAASPEAGPLEFATALRNAHDLRSEEPLAETDPGEDAVQSMTMHVSKGLEFDVVVLADVHGQGFTALRRGEAHYAREHGAVILENRKQPGGNAWQWAKEAAAQRMREERWRLWYVGMTRARERLCLAVSNRGWGKELADSVGFPDRLVPGARVVESGQVDSGP